MIEKKKQGIHQTVGQRTAILKICDFVPGNLFLVKRTVHNF
jgi:hypothetical protein